MENQEQESVRGRRKSRLPLIIVCFVGGLAVRGILPGPGPTLQSLIGADLSYQFNTGRETEKESIGNRDAPNDPPIPLQQLVGDYSNMSQFCQNHGLFLMEDVVLPESITHSNRKIPRVVHVTSKTRCVSKPFFDGLSSWKFENHSFYFHDDEAVDKLLSRFWPEFPHLQLVMNCLVSGAALADLWRYLVLWEHGGIYTDIDNLPGLNFTNGNDIRPDDDAYFLQERGGFPSQYFFAISPKHPAMFMAVQATLYRLLTVTDVGAQYVPYVTGPGALCNGFELFAIRGPGDKRDYHKPPAGMYHGIDGRTARVVGDRNTNSKWVKRSAINGRAKNMGWKQMGMTDYARGGKAKASNMSCFQTIHKAVLEQGLGSFVNRTSESDNALS